MTMLLMVKYQKAFHLVVAVASKEKSSASSKRKSKSYWSNRRGIVAKFNVGKAQSVGHVKSLDWYKK